MMFQVRLMGKVTLGGGETFLRQICFTPSMVASTNDVQSALRRESEQRAGGETFLRQICFTPSMAATTNDVPCAPRRESDLRGVKHI